MRSRLRPRFENGRRAALAGLALVGLGGCEIVATPHVAQGIGAGCTVDSDCQASWCQGGVCARACSVAADCPDHSVCTARGLCELPLRAGFIYPTVVGPDGWSLAHDEGRLVAERDLPYLSSDTVDNTHLQTDVSNAVERMIAAGHDVVISTSFGARGVIEQQALGHPETRFFVCAGNTTAPNVGSYFARMEEAFFLAGHAAALNTHARRLGFVASYVTPAVVRHINAFTLGARAVDPGIVVEVRWVGAWFDGDPPNVDGKHRETVLAEQLLGTGCDVIAHDMDNGLVVEAVEHARQAGARVFSIGHQNADACNHGPSSCLGAAYWNWGPLYRRLLDQVHRHAWDPSVVVNDRMRADADESVVNFHVEPSVAGFVATNAVNDVLARLDREGGERLVFQGAYCSTGQRSPRCVLGGDTVGDAELASMCWFVEGVVERALPADPTSVDQPARVPPECAIQQ